MRWLRPHLCPHDARAAPELVFARVEVHGAALALLAADGKAVQLRRNVAHARPPEVLDAVAPVGRDDVVVLRDRCLDTNGNGLLEQKPAGKRQSVLRAAHVACPQTNLAVVQVAEATDLACLVIVIKADLHAAHL